MHSKTHYVRVASVHYGEVYLSHSSLTAVSRIHRKRIQCAGSEPERVIELGRYAIFRIGQALYRPRISQEILQQMVSLLDEAITLLLAAEASSRMNINRYTCLISQFRKEQVLAEETLNLIKKNNTPKVFD